MKAMLRTARPSLLVSASLFLSITLIACKSRTPAATEPDGRDSTGEGLAAAAPAALPPAAAVDPATWGVSPQPGVATQTDAEIRLDELIVRPSTADPSAAIFVRPVRPAEAIATVPDVDPGGSRVEAELRGSRLFVVRRPPPGAPQLWSYEKDKEPLLVHEGPVLGFSVSPDGDKVLVLAERGLEHYTADGLRVATLRSAAQLAEELSDDPSRYRVEGWLSDGGTAFLVSGAEVVGVDPGGKPVLRKLFTLPQPESWDFALLPALGLLVYSDCPALHDAEDAAAFAASGAETALYKAYLVEGTEPKVMARLRARCFEPERVGPTIVEIAGRDPGTRRTIVFGTTD